MAAWILPVAMAAGSAVSSAASSSKAGKQEMINARLRAQQIERNALIAKRNMEREEQLGSMQRAESRERGREFLGAQLVQQLQSGVEMAGTPMRNAMITANQIELEINKQSWLNEENALALQMQAEGFESQAQHELYFGRAKRDALKNQAKMSLLTGAANTGAAYYGNT